MSGARPRRVGGKLLERGNDGPSLKTRPHQPHHRSLCKKYRVRWVNRNVRVLQTSRGSGRRRWYRKRDNGRCLIGATCFVPRLRSTVYLHPFLHLRLAKDVEHLPPLTYNTAIRAVLDHVDALARRLADRPYSPALSGAVVACDSEVPEPIDALSARATVVRYCKRGVRVAEYRVRGTRAGRVNHAFASPTKVGTRKGAPGHPTCCYGCAVTKGVRVRGWRHKSCRYKDA